MRPNKKYKSGKYKVILLGVKNVKTSKHRTFGQYEFDANKPFGIEKILEKLVGKDNIKDTAFLIVAKPIKVDETSEGEDISQEELDVFQSIVELQKIRTFEAQKGVEAGAGRFVNTLQEVITMVDPELAYQMLVEITNQKHEIKGKIEKRLKEVEEEELESKIWN